MVSKNNKIETERLLEEVERLMAKTSHRKPNISVIDSKSSLS
jgi:hypothetical protein